MSFRHKYRSFPMSLSSLRKQWRQRTEREKFMFRIKAKIPEDLLKEHITEVKTGLPGMAYLRLDPEKPWPENLQSQLNMSAQAYRIVISSRPVVRIKGSLCDMGTPSR